MGLLTEYREPREPEFDKEQVIYDIKEGLKRDFPEWACFTSPDYEFDLIVMRTKTVNESLTLVGNDWTLEQTKFEQRQYQIVYGVAVGDSILPEKFNGALVLCVSSARELFKTLVKHG